MTDLVQHTHLIKKCHLVPLTLVTHLQMVWHLLVHIARCHNDLHYTLLSVYNLITKILHVLCQPICLNYTSLWLNTCNVYKSNKATESPISKDLKKYTKHNNRHANPQSPISIISWTTLLVNTWGEFNIKNIAVQ